jgi:hypothetical protein
MLRKVHFFLHFSCPWIRIPNPDPRKSLNPDPIRIRIHNPGQTIENIPDDGGNYDATFACLLKHAVILPLPCIIEMTVPARKTLRNETSLTLIMFKSSSLWSSLFAKVLL